METVGEAGREHLASQYLMGMYQGHPASILDQCRGQFRTDIAAANDGNVQPLAGKPSQAVVILDRAEIAHAIARRQIDRHRCAASRQQQFAVADGVAVIRRHRFLAAIDGRDASAGMQRGAVVLLRLHPDLVVAELGVGPELFR